MSRGVQAFKETDLVKACRAARKAGMAVQRFEIERGKITVIVDKAPPIDPDGEARG